MYDIEESLDTHLLRLQADRPTVVLASEAEIRSVADKHLRHLDPTRLDFALSESVCLDEKTGAPIALMDGGYLTAMRTGGVAGLAI